MSERRSSPTCLSHSRLRISIVWLCCCFASKHLKSNKKGNTWHRTFKKETIERYFRTVVSVLEIYVDLCYITAHIFLVVFSSLRILIFYVVLRSFYFEDVHSRSSKCKLSKLSLHVRINVIKLIKKNILWKIFVLNLIVLTRWV